MPREEHIMRQVEWKKRLEPYGSVELKKQLIIRGARIIADVYAQIEGKELIIEIGDIGDDRKKRSAPILRRIKAKRRFHL